MNHFSLRSKNEPSFFQRSLGSFRIIGRLIDFFGVLHTMTLRILDFMEIFQHINRRTHGTEKDEGAARVLRVPHVLSQRIPRQIDFRPRRASRPCTRRSTPPPTLVL